MLFLKRFFFILLLVPLVVSSCSDTPSPAPDTYIIKTSVITINENEFAEELELKKAAYPYSIKDDPFTYNQLVLSLVKMLTEEAVLLTAAANLGVDVSDAQLDQAVAEFKEDYPDDSFEQILLENAISYPLWLHRFKKHMIMDKLIDQELRQKIEITSEDIVRFYETFQNELNDGTEGGKQSVLNRIDDEKELVSRLRMQKTQDRYESWIQDLAKLYPIQINNDRLKPFLIKDPGK